MKISKMAVLILSGAAAAAALTGCGYTDIRDDVVGGYQTVEDSVVSGWNDMVDHFVADAPLYGVETPTASSQSAQ